MNHEVKKKATNGLHRVIYHSHVPNVIALTFVLPLDDKVFTRELWEMMTECPVIFPDGIGVIPWMVPGGRDIAVESSKLMKNMMPLFGHTMESSALEKTLIIHSV